MIYSRCSIACYLLLPATLQKTSLMFPHRNMSPPAPVTASTLAPGSQVSLGQHQPTRGMLDTVNTTEQVINLTTLVNHNQPVSIQNLPPSQPPIITARTIYTETQTASLSPIDQISNHMFIQSNHSLPVGSTARLHCRVSNVGQLKVFFCFSELAIIPVSDLLDPPF